MMYAFALAAALVLQQATPAPSPQATSPSSPQATTAPTQSPSSSATQAPHQNQHTNNGHKVRTLRQGNLTGAELKYALTHQAAIAKKLQAMKTIKFENLRVYHAPPGLVKKYLHSAFVSTVAYEPFKMNDAVAQSVGSWLNLIANVAVTDSLNGSLNNNNVNLSLNDVLNGNNIAIGQVVGIYINSAGVITTVV